ncbi:X-Pro dipeptidyl-peptidase protein [Aspergillus cavernicola]|uniref:X-Pro dipeptidyl-peptidase protein n=1 Tax=Aspergillus cavernicola TaxID=176166 RepID=A0ABR4HCZ0_9EURO
MLPISILKGSITLAGLLFQPQNITSTLPGLVVIHPGGGVKEQVASIYAEKLSQQGYVTVAYDAAYQGDSGGLPHFLEDPNSRVTDASAVVDYLETLDYVDPDRIAVVGICAGGGYAAAAAKGDHRLKAVAAVSAVNIGDGNREGWLGTEDAAGKISVLDEIAGPIQAEANGNKPEFINYVPSVPDESTPYDLRDAADYYLTPRAQHPNAQNKMLARSQQLILNFDAWDFADMYLNQPTLLIYGDLAESKWHSERFYNKMQGNNTKVSQYVIPGGRHMDFYDRPTYVDPSVQRIADFFRQV